MLKIGLRTLSILACMATLTGCPAKDSSSDASISSQAITTAKVGEEYRYELSIKDGKASDTKRELSTIPSWLQLEITEPLTDLSTPLPEKRGFSFTGLAEAPNGDIYFSYYNFITGYANEVSGGLMKIPHNGKDAELVTTTLCDRINSCTDLLIMDNTLFISQHGLGHDSKIFMMNLDNPSAGTTLLPHTIPHITALTKDNENNLYAADYHNGIYKITAENIKNGSGGSELITNPATSYASISDVAFNPANGHIYFSDVMTGVYDATENKLDTGSIGTASIAYSDNGGLYMSDNAYTSPRLITNSLNNTITTLTQSSTFKLLKTNSGEIILANLTTNTIQAVDVNAEKAILFGTPSVKDIGSHDVNLKLSSGNNQAFKIEVTGGAYTVGGTVTNLAGLLKFSLWNATTEKSETISLLTQSPEDTSFTFGRSLTTGDEYEIQLVEVPEHQTCQVRNSGNQNTGKGTIDQSNVDSVVIDCAFKSYSIGGSITGLTDTLELTANSKTYTYSANDSEWKIEDLEALGEYAVTIKSAPEGYYCTIGSTGTVASLKGDITDAHITCSPLEFPIDVTVTGLTGSLKLQLNTVGQELTIDTDGDYQFNSVAYDSDYSVTVSQQPEGQTCALTNKEGKVSANNIVGVTCTDDTPPAVERNINVTVVGLPNDGGTTTVPLRAWGPIDNRWSHEDRAFSLGAASFTNTLLDGELFDIRIFSSPAGFSCSFTAETSSPVPGYDAIDGIGIVNGDVEITITCTPTI